MTRLPIEAGAYVIERILAAYLVIDTSGGDEHVVARCEFNDEESRKGALHAAIRTAHDLNQTRAEMAKVIQ